MKDKTQNKGTHQVIAKDFKRIFIWAVTAFSLLPVLTLIFIIYPEQLQRIIEYFNRQEILGVLMINLLLVTVLSVVAYYFFNTAKDILLIIKLLFFKENEYILELKKIVVLFFARTILVCVLIGSIVLLIEYSGVTPIKRYLL